MKDIKFRAWVKPFKSMVSIVGFTSYHNNNITIFFPNDKSLTMMKDDIYLLQYTGLSDKSGLMM